MAQRNDEDLYLRNLSSGDPRYGTFVFQPRPGAKIPNLSGPLPLPTNFEDPRSLVLPDGSKAGDAGDVIPALISWEPKDGDASFPENLVGWDMSMDVSNRERHGWYTSDKYLGDDHRKYIAQASSLMDEPLIPVSAAQRYGWAGESQGGSITPRQFLDAMPKFMFDKLSSGSMEDAQVAYTKYLPMLGAYLDGSGVPFSETPEGRAVWAELTGQIYDRNANKYAGDIARSMINAIGMGRTNYMDENDPSMPQAEFDQLKQQYGDDANRMLTPGGVENAKREAAFDFFGAMQNGQHFAPHLDAYSMGIAALTSSPGASEYPGNVEAEPQKPGRFTQLASGPAFLGRMQLASQKLDQVQDAFRGAEQNPGRPFVTQANYFNRTDPETWGGLFNLAGNSSWAYGRNIQNPYEPIFGELRTRAKLADGFTDDPLKFFRDVNDRTFRETPIRPDWQTPEQFRETRSFALDRRGSNLDYYDTLKPTMVDAYNSTPAGFLFPMRRTYPTGAGSIAMSLLPAVAKSAPQTAMVLGGAVPGMLGKAGAGAGAAGAVIGTGKEMLEEIGEEAVMNPSGAASLMNYKTSNSWMQPYPPGSTVRDADGNEYVRSKDEYRRMLNPENKDEWDRAVQETWGRRDQEAQRQFDQWRQNTKLAPMLLD